MMKTSIKRMKSWKNRMAQWLSIVLIHCSLFTATSCIEPPLYLPAEEVLVEMPIVIMDMEIVWNVDVDWKTQWLYGWDVIDEEISGRDGRRTVRPHQLPHTDQLRGASLLSR